MVRTRDKIVVPKSFIEEAMKMASSYGGGQSVLAPIDELGSFLSLAEETGRLALENPGEGVLMLGDAGTLARTEGLRDLAAVAERTVVFGERPKDWEGVKNLTWYDLRGDLTTHDRFLIVLSPSMCLAMLGKLQVESSLGDSTFEGGWTGSRGCVGAIAEWLFRAYEPEGAGIVGEVLESGDEDLCGVSVMKITYYLSQQLMARQQDLSEMKDDLFSVLNILKAISTRKRAHDILFVFVERVAKIIQADRCSVVRIWGGEEIGHVVATHDDKSVTDLTIDLVKYPELTKALDSRKKVVIPDAYEDSLTEPFTAELKKAGISTVIIIPMVLYDENVGSLLLRAARRKGTFSMRELSFCEIAAEAAANALERAHLFESIQEANRRLEHLAITDGLTGLYNHRYLRSRLEEEFERARRYSQPLSCVIIDLDDFKNINDTYGHLKGDMVLREIAAAIRGSVRKNDVVARYGGEEFVAVMPQTGLSGGKTEAERLRDKVANQQFSGLPEDLRVTVSIGLAVLDQEKMSDVESFLRAADSALYEAKEAGKNRVVVAR